MHGVSAVSPAEIYSSVLYAGGDSAFRFEQDRIFRCFALAPRYLQEGLSKIVDNLGVAAPVHVARREVDGNGKRELLLRFEIQDTGIECGDTSATLTGQTYGESIFGSSPTKTVQCYTFTTIDVPGDTRDQRFKDQ